MEADLLSHYGVDYRDRWRYDADGRRLLSLRRLAVLVRHLPTDSAVARARNGGSAPWTRDQVLIADMFHVWTGSPHPLLPKPPESPEKAKAREAGKERLALRRGAIERGLVA